LVALFTFGCGCFVVDLDSEVVVMSVHRPHGLKPHSVRSRNDRDAVEGALR
jgi:hypothetical protein